MDKSLNKIKEYIETLKERKKKSRVYKEYQLIGLTLAEILEDEKHKSLYIKLAKEHEVQMLLTLAKDVASRNRIKNKGAYFMVLLTEILRNKSKRSKSTAP